MDIFLEKFSPPRLNQEEVEIMNNPITSNVIEIGKMTTKTKQLAFSSVQMLSCVRLFATSWTAAHQASLSITTSQSLPKFMSIESVMPSNHLHNWMLFLLWLHPFILSGVIFPLISSSILGTYRPGEFLHGVSKSQT